MGPGRVKSRPIQTDPLPNQTVLRVMARHRAGHACILVGHVSDTQEEGGYCQRHLQRAELRRVLL